MISHALSTCISPVTPCVVRSYRRARCSAPWYSKQISTIPATTGLEPSFSKASTQFVIPTSPLDQRSTWSKKAAAVSRLAFAGRDGVCECYRLGKAKGCMGPAAVQDWWLQYRTSPVNVVSKAGHKLVCQRLEVCEEAYQRSDDESLEECGSLSCERLQSIQDGERNPV